MKVICNNLQTTNRISKYQKPIMEPTTPTADKESSEVEELKSQITALKSQLAAAKSQASQIPPLAPPPHLWLLLADSALPIGSFAFSSGLESYISHRSLRPVTGKPTPKMELIRFLRLSLLSVSTTTVPFIAAAFRDPSGVMEVDDVFDSSTTCEVARRASISQGRALCSVWDKSFAASLLDTRGCGGLPTGFRPEHFGPAWGYITRLCGVEGTDGGVEMVGFVFLFNHVKALLSAAVRLSLIGPYVAQQVLASEEVVGLVKAAVGRGVGIPVEEAGQSVPTVDLWQGRHERLYTRIFNS
ncbi:hypothetical protein TWF481_005394 [Arthrobotrys musiformis]|uniref:Urease accessory protein UreF n=1 Tax=Arthrobotrys musiformis TaxID=47236 RepID=A0AAV9WDM1_9PEZI